MKCELKFESEKKLREEKALLIKERWQDGKESASKAGDAGSNPGHQTGKISHMQGTHNITGRILLPISQVEGSFYFRKIQCAILKG